MNNKFLKSFSIIGSAALVIMLAISCVKSRSGYTDLTKTSDFVILTNAGTGNFKAANVLANTTSPDTLKKIITAVLASSNSDNGSVTVTIGIDNSVIATYNAANGTNFQPFPANAYKIVNNSITIPGGLDHTGTSTLWIFQNKLDPAISYLLPVAITDGGGKTLSSNQNIIYYNVIGNPLAGYYTTAGTRYNYVGSIGYSCGSPIPAGYSNTATSPNPKLAAPVDSKVIAIDYANLGGSNYQYLISIDPANPNNAIVTSNSTLASALSVTYCIHTYNPTTKTFHILSTYNNGAGGVGGSDRIIDEVFTHQ
jgi:hypothetical protein